MNTFSRDSFNIGNVQYTPLNGDYKYDERPVANDYNPNSSNYNQIDEQNEMTYKPSAFNINSAKYFQIGLTKNLFNF